MPRLAIAACLVLGLVFATAMTRPAAATEDAQTAALATEAHALIADLQEAATSADTAEHPLALLESPAAFEALTIYRDAGAFRLTAAEPGVALLTVSDPAGTPCLQVRFDRTSVLETTPLV